MKAIRVLMALVVSAALLLGACTKKPSTETASPAADNSASQPANQGQAPVPQPSADQGQASSAATVPAAPAVAERPPAPKPKPTVIPAGTVITVRLGETVGSKTSHDGDRFDASVAQPVSIRGKTIVPVGSSAAGTVTQAHAAGRFKGGATLGLALTSLRIAGSDYQIQSTPVSQSSKGKGKRTVAMVGGGAGLGAIIGGIAGGGKGAAIGALVGGGAGTAGAGFTGKRDISLPAESALSFQLTAPLTLRAHGAESQD
jgi:hypothetical protein